MNDIYIAMCEMLESWAMAFSPPVPVAFTNVPFTPPSDGSPWLELLPLINDPIDYSLANSGAFVEMGIFRVMVVYRPDSGMVTPLQIAEAVRVEFAKGKFIGPARIYTHPAIGSPVQYNERMAIPVSVWWRVSRKVSEPIVTNTEAVVII